MKNKIIAIFMVLMFCFLSSFPFCSVGSSDVVYAAEVTSQCFSPSGGATWSTYISDDYKAQVTSALKRLFDRCNLNSDDYYIFIKEVSTYQNAPYINNLNIFPKNGSTEQYKSENNRYYNILVWSSAYRISTTISNLDNINSMTFTANNGFYKQGVFYNSDVGYGFGEIRDYGNGAVQASPSFTNSWVFIDTFNPPYVPRPDTFYALDLSINETSFYQWIIDNNKLSELPSYITQTKLLSFISFYNQFGSNFGNFLRNIPDWFSHMNIVNQTSENVNILKSSMDRLYQEYFNSFWVEVGYGNATNLPHHRRNIQTQTTDDDTSLITDESTDTLDISILRDILRGIIQVSNQIGDGTNSIINKLDQLDFTVNLTNGGGSSVTDLSVLYEYDINDFNDDFETFEENVSDITAVPLSYVQTINNNSLMPENMLSDKQSLTVNIPVINGFTVNSDGTQYETNTDIYTLNSTDYPWLDTIVKKMKRFASIMLIIGYLIHLRFKIADIVRGE